MNYFNFDFRKPLHKTNKTSVRVSSTFKLLAEVFFSSRLKSMNDEVSSFLKGIEILGSTETRHSPPAI